MSKYGGKGARFVMRIHPQVLRQTGWIALSEALCCLVAFLVCFLLGMGGKRLLAGLCWGGAWAVANFFLLGLTAQRAAAAEQPGAVLRRSCALRALLTLSVGAAALCLPGIDGAAAVLALFFPRLTLPILYRRSRKEA